MKTRKLSVPAAFAAIVLLTVATEKSAIAQCPSGFVPAGSSLASDINIYPNGGGGDTSPSIPSTFMVDVINQGQAIPVGLYEAWCVDEQTETTFTPVYGAPPGTPVNGFLYPTCDSGINGDLLAYDSQLCPHPNTQNISSTTWLEVDYILNYYSANPGVFFYWDVQAAINTLVGSAAGSFNKYCNEIITTPVPDNCGGYPGFNAANVAILLATAQYNVVTKHWVPACGDVIGVVYVTDPCGQFLLIAVPYSCSLGRGDTATIGFWHNKNGQALIDSLNGGPKSTLLATYLATTYPCLYGSLTGKDNADVAKLFLTYFGVTGQKTQAQILAGALAAYATDSALAGTVAGPYGFKVTSAGTGADTYNVGSNGTAIGLSNNTSYTIDYLLQVANSYCPLSPGSAAANALNNIFSDINQGGDIN
jgi:hypothetical protein